MKRTSLTPLNITLRHGSTRPYTFCIRSAPSSLKIFKQKIQTLIPKKALKFQLSIKSQHTNFPFLYREILQFVEVFLESYKVWFAKVVPEIVSFSVTRSTFFSVFTEHFYLKGIHFRTTRLTGNIFIGDFWRMYQTYQSKFTEQGTDQSLDRFHEAFETMCSRSTGRQVSLSKNLAAA